MTTFARLGAVLYAIWGLLHLPIAYQVYAVGSGLETGPVQGRVAQVAFYLGVAGVGAAVAISFWNWRNGRTAYWANLLLGLSVDAGFVLFVLLPGYVTLARGLPAPAMFVLAAILSTVGYLGAREVRGAGKGRG